MDSDRPKYVVVEVKDCPRFYPHSPASCAALQRCNGDLTYIEITEEYDAEEYDAEEIAEMDAHVAMREADRRLEEGRDPEISWFEWGLLAIIIGACSAFIVYGIGVGVAHLAGWLS